MLTDFIDQTAEPYRKLFEDKFNYYFSKNNHNFKLHFFVCCNIFILYYWVLGLANILHIYLQDNNQKYQIQSKKKLLPSAKKFKKLILVVLMNQILSVLEICCFLMIQYPHSPKVPTLSELIYQIAIFFLIGELTYYYGHRALHLRPFYKRIHHVHHQWKAPFGLTTFFCHPLEQLTVNMLPMVLGPALLGSHLFTTYLWYVIVQSISFYVHSGQAFPWALPALSRMHDAHHQK